VPVRTKQNHIFSIVDALAIQEPTDKTDMHAVLRSIAESAPRRGLMVLVSDLLTDREGLFRGLRLLRQCGHDVLILHVMDDEELDFEFAGPTRFDGLETTDFLNCNPRALREGYLQALQVFLDEVRRQSARNACDYSLIRTREPLDAALATFLSKRLSVMNRY
jgi:uncharacterized protein (DUF58 family)